MKKACLTSFFLLFLLSFTFSFIMNSVPVKASLTKMFVSPSYSILTDSIYFTVEVRVENVWKMNSYQAYLWWDPELLNVTEVIQSPFLSNNSQYTTSFTSRINNTLGRLIVIEAQLSTDYPSTAVGGNATLFTVNFMAKSTGQCLLHLNKTDINYGRGDVSHDTEDGFFNNELYNVEAGGGNFPVKVESNSTVYNFDFNLSEMSISFNVSGVSGSAGWVNVTIPKALLDAPEPDQWTILLDSNPITYTKTENATHTYLYINYTHTTHTITITGTQVIPEFTLLTLLILLTAVFATVILFVKKFKNSQLQHISL